MQFAKNPLPVAFFSRGCNQKSHIYHLDNIQNRNIISSMKKYMDMMDIKPIIFTLAALFSTAVFADVQTAKVSDKLKTAWDSPALREQIDAGIKANRMSDFILKFRTPNGPWTYDDKKVSNVKVELVKHDFLFGCNAFLIDGFRNADGTKNEQECDKYGETFAKIFNFATLSFYWPEIEPRENYWRFAKDSEYIYRRPAGDTSVEFCKKYGLTAKGHCLVWNVNKRHGQPDWAVEARDAQFYKKSQLRNMREIAKRYGDFIKIWDVVNESGSYRNEPAMQYDDYIYQAFKEAERVFPGDVVLINNETDQAFSQAIKDDYTGRFFQTNNYLIAKGAKLDAIGIQYHVFSEKRWQDILDGKIEQPEFFLSALDFFAKQKRPIHITEITIPSMGEHGEDNQAFWIEKLYSLWFSHPSVEAITWWNLVDGTAASGEDKWKGGLVNRDFSPKKAYKVLDNLINEKWHTSVSFDEEGSNFHFRGFYGTYKVTYTIDGKTESQLVRLSKGTRVRPVFVNYQKTKKAEPKRSAFLFAKFKAITCAAPFKGGSQTPARESFSSKRKFARAQYRTPTPSVARKSAHQFPRYWETSTFLVTPSIVTLNLLVPGTAAAFGFLSAGDLSLKASRGFVYKSSSCCGNIAYITQCSSSSLSPFERSCLRKSSMPGFFKSAGRQEIGSFPEIFLASSLTSGSTGAGVCP